MGSISHLVSLLLLTFACQVLSQATIPGICCQTKSVTNAPAPNQALNGEYVLKSSSDNKPDPNCADGCVYMRGNDEFCFIAVPEAEAAEVKCDLSGVTGGTPQPGGGVTEGNTGGQQPGGSTGGATGGSTSATDLAAQAADANARKTQTENEIAEANNLNNEITAVQSKISSLTSTSGTTPNTGRKNKRQATVAPVAPITSCAALVDAINQINTAVGSNSKTANI